MDSDYGGPYRLHSTHSLHSSGLSHLQCFDGYSYTGQEIGMMQHQHLQHNQHWLRPHSYLQPQPQPQFHLHLHHYPLSSAQSHDWHGAVQIEIEKERIRQEIIMSEILRRRALEAEVRRELMMEEEMALQRGGSGFPLGSPSPMVVDMSISPPLVETRAGEPFLDERSVSLTQRPIGNYTREGGCSEPLLLQRASNDVRTTGDSMVRDSEIKPVSEGSEKKKIILLAKPIEIISGAKRARSGSVSSEPQSDGNSKKKKKTANGEWSCALCQVIAPNERNLNQHLGGKKHKKKEAAQHATKSSKIGLRTKKVAKPIKYSETSNPVTEVKRAPEPLSFAIKDSETSNPVTEVKRASEPRSLAKPGDASTATDGLRPLQGSLNSDNLKKDESVVTKKETSQYWCEICEVCPPTKKAMEIHQQGKRHKRQLQNRAVESTCKFWCEICEVGPLTEKTLKGHQQGRKHKRQLQKQSLEKTATEYARVVKQWREKIMDKEGKDRVAVEKTS